MIKTEATVSVNRKLKVAVLYGGQSGEHEVSLMSAASVMEELDEAKYDVTPVFISKEGHWDVPLDSLRQFDVVFPVLHGPMGEDGTVQGLLKLLGVPFVGAGVVGSAVGMDKAIFKDIMRAHGLPVAKSLVVLRSDWDDGSAQGADGLQLVQNRRKTLLERIESELGWPIFVKPANMGSSVGISKVKAPQDFPAAMDEALKWDRKVLLEASVPHARELEVSVLGNDELRASVVGEVRPRREFYDYAAKYLVKGEEESELIIPAPLPDETTARLRELAVQVARLADIQGMTRVDFLVNGQSGDIYVNEINTIPGFTSISMYPKLWIETGMTYAQLLDRLIQLAQDK
ncbi:MAG: D-alanine--D-alanine ligase [Chloroflexi bacterium]|nr:D-alanine--D-alanine ligase [Chloroflexota bacterium]MCL5274236.1 D-alanine--D-alanine ligase [Chloroflexota bacterium]